MLQAYTLFEILLQNFGYRKYCPTASTLSVKNSSKILEPCFCFAKANFKFP
ncbi:MAG: hypothetical protein MR878_05910 [Campylobacter sp.]|nr:hypothetical protein [Campylobacter sp.]MDD6162182.1 hypothetical protein [Campylobacteraceae bacterium]